MSRKKKRSMFAGLSQLFFHRWIFFVLSSVPAENLYYMYLDQKNPSRKYYSQYASFSLQNIQLKTGFAARLQSTLLKKVSMSNHDF